jgi:uncharacterized protein
LKKKSSTKFFILLKIFRSKIEQKRIKNPSLELQIVQDADRLDAIGAIGIARTFNFGGFKNNLMYHPDIQPKLNMSKEEYKKSNGTTNQSFLRKTSSLKRFNEYRNCKKNRVRKTRFYAEILDEFYKEWKVEI